MNAAGVLTPGGYLSSLLSQMAHLSLSGQPEALAGVLGEIAAPLNGLGRNDLGSRLLQVSEGLGSGTYLRTQWITSPLYGELEAIKEALDRGEPVEVAVQYKKASETLSELVQEVRQKLDKSVTARTVRLSIGPKPLIDWEKFGSKKHPAPNSPGEGVDTAGKRLSYFFHFVAGRAGYGGSERESDPEKFYEISGGTRRRMVDGHYAPKAMGQFPSTEAQRIIGLATTLEPLYGRLMRELMFHAIFESQEWPLGLPEAGAPWDASFLYGLRRYFAAQLLSEEGKSGVLADRALTGVVRRKNSLEKVNWHSGRTRREVFEPWLSAMNPENGRHLEKQRRYIGDSILRTIGWKAPPASASEDSRLQWLVRYWSAHYHYGALPARGLPVPTDVVVRFVHARNPANLQPGFRSALLETIRDFYAAEEIESLTVRRSA